MKAVDFSRAEIANKSALMGGGKGMGCIVQNCQIMSSGDLFDSGCIARPPPQMYRQYARCLGCDQLLYLSP